MWALDFPKDGRMLQKISSECFVMDVMRLLEANHYNVMSWLIEEGCDAICFRFENYFWLLFYSVTNYRRNGLTVANCVEMV